MYIYVQLGRTLPTVPPQISTEIGFCQYMRYREKKVPAMKTTCTI